MESSVATTNIDKGVYEDTSLDLEYIKAVFELMCTQTQFVFVGTPGDENYDSIRQMPALSNSPVDIGLNLIAGGERISRGFRNNVCRIDLLKDGWLEYFENMDQERPLHRLNALYHFAGVLGHEIAHAFFGLVHPVACLVLHEPRYAKHEAAGEIGWAYEKWLFGDIYNPEIRSSHTHRIHLIHSTDLRSYARHSEPEKGPTVWQRPPIFKILTAKVVESWFVQSTWQKLKKRDHAWQIRKPGRTTLQCLEGGVDWYYDGELRGKLRNVRPASSALFAAAVGFFKVARYM